MSTSMRQKRSRSNKDQDDDMYMNLQADDIPPDAYSRSRPSYHVSEDYRVPSNSSRRPYVSERDVAPRSRHEDDWRHRDPDHDRYPYNDTFALSDRGEYEDGGARNSSGWVSLRSSQYPQSSVNWAHRFDSAAPSSSYPKQTVWGATNAYEHSRTAFPERWHPEGSRDMPLEDWSQEPPRTDHTSDRRPHEWQRTETRRDKALSHKFQSDSGWDSRRRDRSDWTGETSGRPDEAPHHRNGIHSTEDRSWEPAASWKSSSSNDQPHRNNQRSNSSRQKRGYNQAKQRREWRTDDGDLNNWTRRDIGGQSGSKISPSQHPGKRKHRQPSRSRSRSRSPAESYKSRPSSRGRSRSHSVSPLSKRRRKDASPANIRSRTPSERSTNRQRARGERYQSRSPSPAHSNVSMNGHHRSPSISSQNSDRSPSQSPTGAARSVHRLPAISDNITTSQTNIIKDSHFAGSRKSDKSQNPKSWSQNPGRKNKNLEFFPDREYDRPLSNNHPSAQYERHSIYERPSMQDIPQTHSSVPLSLRDRLSNHDARTIYERPSSHEPPSSHNRTPEFAPSHTTSDLNIRAITIPMPPPPSIPSSHIQRTRFTSSQEFPNQGNGSIYDPEAEAIPPPVRGRYPKNAGFKPIAKASSSLKKFFPGDEEDMDTNPDMETSSSVRVENHESSSSYDAQSSATWNRRFSSAVEENMEYRIHEGSTKDVSSHQANYLVPARVPSHYLPDAEQTSTPELPPTDVHHSLLNDDRSSPHSMDTKDTSHSRALSREVDVQATPPTHIAGESTNGAPPSSSLKDLYKIVSQVGEGTFGKVYKARNAVTGTHVALKRIRMESERDGFPVTAMREIKLLQSLRHDNVVKLYEMMVSNGSVYMVFEYMDHDLTGVLSQNQFTFSDAHLKSLCHQMLAGLAYLHHKGVIHRDIKGSNILINNRGELKLADFGLARFYQKRRRTDYTNRVITLWYRPPELLFGATVYGPEVDMWSAGCIMLELFTKKPVFQGVDEIHQVEVVFKLLGTPTSETWSHAMSLPWFELVKPQQVLSNRFREAFQKWMSPAALDLAEQLLTYDPTQRITASQAMDTPYFTEEEPPASRPIGLVDLEGEWHELETKRERAKRKERKNTT